MSNEKHIDESWKDAINQDKLCDHDHEDCGCGHEHENEAGEVEVNFFNYIASMGYQAMIFLGEVPNPMTQQMGQNLRQAKFLLDTLALVHEKTKGNLTAQEDQFLSSTLHELQLKYVEVTNKGRVIQ